MVSQAYALARAELIHSLTAHQGITTADGAPGGTTIVDANLIGMNDFITEKAVLIMSGPAAYEDKGAASFVPGTGVITLQGAGFSAQIKAGTIYRILNISSVEMDVATINTKIGTNVDAAGTTTLFAWMANLLAAMGRTLFTMDFWSVPQEEVALTNVAGDKGLPTITIADLPDGATIVKAFVMFKFRMVENTNAAENELAGAQEIQIQDDGGGAWTDAINFVANMFRLATNTREGGDVIIGAIDVSGAGFVDGNDTYNVQWDEAVATLDGINFNDVQVGLRIWYSV